MIRLLIKGGLTAAEAELAKRRIPTYGASWSSTSDLRGQITHTDVPDMYADQVIRWFTEQASPPFPSGTLLLYNFGDGRSNRKTA
jgi:hypothetical protein